MGNKYNVIIVGAGPAGIFSALEIIAKNKNAKILIVEKGKDIDKRNCPMTIKNTQCKSCPECAVLNGWGGAGAYSDGKLNVSPDIGGFLPRYVDRTTLNELIDYVDNIYLKFGAPRETFEGSQEDIEKIKSISSQNNLTFLPSKIRHIGTDGCRVLLKKMKKNLNSKVKTLFGTEAAGVIIKNGKAVGIRLKNGKTIHSDFTILAPGREGSMWLEKQAKRLRLTQLQNPVDIGVRVEVPASVLERFTSIVYEPKLIFQSKKFDDKVRTFCVNPYGEVVKEHLKDMWTVNGHSYANKKTDNTNFALLVSTVFTEPFKEPISYGKYIAKLANFLGQGVIVQRLGDLKNGRRSTHERIKAGLVKPTLKDATPGDLSFVLPYRYLNNILEMLEALDKIAPGVNSDDTLLYGIEVKFYSMQLKLTSALETEKKNLFAIGDGAGVSRSLMHASASGIIAAREITKRMSA